MIYSLNMRAQLGLGVLFGTMLIQAQPQSQTRQPLTTDELFEQVALPEPVPVEVRVWNEAGNPISSARIEYITPTATDFRETDFQGRAIFATRSPQFLIRAEGYRTTLLKNSAPEGMTVTLVAAGDAALSRCDSTGDLLGLNYMHSTLWWPRVEGVTVEEKNYDIDNVTQRFWVETESGRHLMWASSSVYGWGMSPRGPDIWSAAAFSENVMTVENDLPVVDSRGRLSNGLRWRIQSNGLETIQYHDVDPDVAETFDRMLDGVCWALSDNQREALEGSP